MVALPSSSGFLPLPSQPPPSFELPKALGNRSADSDDSRTREAFDDFVGQTFYGQMLKAMRSTVNKPAYFHGGRAEEVFQQQLDQVLAERMSDASADQFTGPMYELFNLQRSN